MFVNKVYSDFSQLQYAYYELPFVCPPSGNKHAGIASGRRIGLNLGEILRGDRITASDYDLVVGRDQECQYLCSQTVDRAGAKRAQQLIDDGYVAEWIVDNLPGATRFESVDRSQHYYAAGFKLGYRDISRVSGKLRHYINNHLTLVIRWRKAPGRAGDNGGKVIVGFEVFTKSVSAGTADRNSTGCPRDVHHLQDGMDLYIAPNNTLLASQYPDASYIPESDLEDDGSTLTIPYTYSVYFRKEKRVEWANRWDMYFKNQEESALVHWLAIFNSLVIAGLMSAVVVNVWNRTIRGDARMPRDNLLEEGKGKGKRRRARSPRPVEKTSNGTGLLDGIEQNEDLDSDDEDVSGYKLLHSDVFRTPAYSGLLAPLLGSGSQLLFMVTGLLLLSCFGILNPSWRGGFISVGMGLFVFAGVFAGYFSGRIYKTFGGVNWRKNTLLTALLFPGLLFSTIFILNLFVWAEASSTALPFSTLIALAALWLLIQLPLVYAGSFVGYYRSPAWEHPTKTSAIPRQIPESSWYAKSLYTILLAGLVPFAVVYIELLFVFRSLWLDKSAYYYAFGFLAIVSLLCIVAVVQVTIVATYTQLSAENYHWWWQSFLVGGASALWIFAYCAWFYLFKLRIEGFVSGVLFFSYSFLACAVWGLGMGTVGFLTAFAWVRRLYRNIKAD